MKDPIAFYQNQQKKHQLTVSVLRKKLAMLSTLRLLVFVLAIAGIYFFRSHWQIALGIGVLGLVLFLYLISKYTDQKRLQNIQKKLVEINAEEIKIASGDFHNRDQGLQFQDPSHFYSLDIDLFGRGSFFQYSNRTTIKEGTELLADILKANDTSEIEIRQQAIKELSTKPMWRQNYEAVASLAKIETPASTIIQWLKQHQRFIPKLMRWFPTVFTIASMVLFVAIYFQLVGFSFAFYWLGIGLVITGRYLKKINLLVTNVDRVRDTFRQYSLLLHQIENEVFQSDLLQRQQQKIKTDTKKASVIFKEFSKALDALDNRNNVFSAIFGNGYLLWDLRQSYRIESWIALYADKVEDWFEVVSFFDAYNSLGNYAFNHPAHVFPKIEDAKTAIEATDLGHPLLKVEKRIDNDLQIDHQQFFIITGANMAGKSTFLRTVSLHIVMANVGLPVCAKSSVYSPVKLITSMRTSDSLADEASYFFSELTRLKFIVDAIQKEPYFIVLDEILKGTNSTDKAIGSRKFVERLVAANATGIIATHDLSLCEIEKELPQVANYYFDAEIVNDELHFDYTFKEGICKNMNASFLLKKMEII